LGSGQRARGSIVHGSQPKGWPDAQRRRREDEGASIGGERELGHRNAGDGGAGEDGLVGGVDGEMNGFGGGGGRRGAEAEKQGRGQKDRRQDPGDALTPWVESR